MTSKGVMSHSAFRNPDWFALRIMEPQQAADALQTILTSLDGAEKQVFALRGMAALIIEERELFRCVYDEETGQYYASLDRFLKCEFPNSWSYIRDALRAVKELKDMPFADLLQIKRVNLEQLRKVSSSVRILPEVVEAAKQMPEKAFVAKLNAEHHQALEVKQPVLMAEQSASAIIDQAVEMAIALEGCGSRSEALEAMAAYCIEGWHTAYEKLLKETA